MKQSNNKQKNLDKIESIIKSNPSTTHIYICRTGEDNQTVDIPLKHAQQTILKHPNWEVLSSNKQMDDEIEALFTDDTSDDGEEKEEEEVIVPPKPSEVKEVEEAKTETNTPKQSNPKKRGHPKKKSI